VVVNYYLYKVFLFLPNFIHTCLKSVTIAIPSKTCNYSYVSVRLTYVDTYTLCWEASVAILLLGMCSFSTVMVSKLAQKINCFVEEKLSCRSRYQKKK